MENSNNHQKIKILDTTLRDGSYAVNFKYTKRHIETIVSGLLEAGIKWIEIGHGMSAGLGTRFPMAVVEDRDCYEMVRALVGNKAYIGAIVAPSLIASNPVRMMAELLDFIRVAVTPESLGVATQYIESIKPYNKPVFAQLVKSHLFKSPKFKSVVLQLVNAGVDVIYVVDTCGNLMPQQIAEMVGEISSICSLPIGFHGHNNSSLALANSLAAITAGASFIDATVGSIGRGAGNTQLEVLLSVLHRMNLFPIHAGALHRIFELTEYLQAEFPNVLPGISPREMAFAHYNLDSTTEDKIKSVCDKYGINFYDFLKALQQCATHDWVMDEDIEQARDVCLMGQELKIGV